MNFEDDTQNVRRLLLDEALAKGIQQNEEQCKIWTTYKKGHQKVAETLQTFQKDLYVNCMVPIGKRALMKGKLIHTNEILACLGDGYFAKYSASGAAALCERRIQKAEEMLKNLNKERDLYETRMMMIETNLFEDYAGGEIVEHWNEDQITEWKKKHREREREYHQKLAKLRQEDRKKIETEDDLLNRLDQLEIEEELADELNRLGDEAYELFGVEELKEGQCYYESESSSNSEEEEKEDDSKDDYKQVLDSDTYQHKVKTCKVKKLVSFAEPEDLLRKEKENLMKEKEKGCEDMVDFEEDILRIEFTHSKNKSVTKSNGDSIETPADIYRLPSKPKSILKRSPNDLPPEQSVPLEYSTEDEDEEDEDTVKPSAYETVVKDIKEKNTLEVTKGAIEKMEKSTNIRPVSKFKRERQRKQ
ncbi:unconventional prefoldin RPB5 interactor-like protein isoform X1 [Bombus pyrosoma]|uniref:unconventional prefoldin RPB5 interactor-like protein isoform X1 n=1 Tax=Bombus pyrosoma TaxID=396416 RepID=UPI001CB94036|nr:unconventional prefoldin RPB5 interactor-like protein isoform X1 [Bombus pyrosoma]